MDLVSKLSENRNAADHTHVFFQLGRVHFCYLVMQSVLVLVMDQREDRTSQEGRGGRSKPGV